MAAVASVLKIEKDVDTEQMLILVGYYHYMDNIITLCVDADVRTENYVKTGTDVDRK